MTGKFTKGSYRSLTMAAAISITLSIPALTNAEITSGKTHDEVLPWQHQPETRQEEHIWSDDFENGNLEKWDRVNDAASIVTSDAHSGEHSVELEGGYERLHREGEKRRDTI